MSPPRTVRCVDCDRVLAAYGPTDDELPICAACAEKPLAIPANEKPALPPLEQGFIDFEREDA